MVGIFAIFHGHAHGTELSEGQNAMLYSLGFVISTGLLHAAGIGIGTAHRWKKGQPLLRAAGAVVMIGWDGATWDVIRPMLRDGELPVLAGLVVTSAEITPVWPGVPSSRTAKV